VVLLGDEGTWLGILEAHWGFLLSKSETEVLLEFGSTMGLAAMMMTLRSRCLMAIPLNTRMLIVTAGRVLLKESLVASRTPVIYSRSVVPGLIKWGNSTWVRSCGRKEWHSDRKMRGNDLDYSTTTEAKSQSNADAVGELYDHSCTYTNSTKRLSNGFFDGLWSIV